MIRLKPDVEWRDLDGEVVALDLGTSAYVAVNETGSVLWPLVAEGSTRGRLVEELTERFPIDPATAEADVEAFLRQLQALNLIGPA